MITISIMIMVISSICISIIIIVRSDTPMGRPWCPYRLNRVPTWIGGVPRIINVLIVIMTLRVQIVYMIRRVRAVFMINQVHGMLMWCVTGRGMVMISLTRCGMLMILGRFGIYIVIVIWKIGTDGTKG